MQNNEEVVIEDNQVEDMAGTVVVSASTIKGNATMANALMMASKGTVSHHVGKEAAEASELEDQIFMTYDGMAQRRTQELNGNKLVIISKTDVAPGLPVMEESIEYTITNKIPLVNLRDALANCKKAYELYKSEFAAQIYRKADGTYFNYYPDQKVYPAHVDYSGDNKAKYELRQIHELVLELHSHCNMGAFFSGGDNANENFPCIYAVFSGMSAQVGTYIARVKCTTVQAPLELDQVFDLMGLSVADAMSMSDLPEFSQDAMDRCIHINNPNINNHGVNGTTLHTAVTNYPTYAAANYEANKAIIDSYRYDPRRYVATYQSKIHEAGEAARYSAMLDCEWIADSVTDVQALILIRLLEDKLRVVNAQNAK